MRRWEQGVDPEAEGSLIATGGLPKFLKQFRGHKIPIILAVSASTSRIVRFQAYRSSRNRHLSLIARQHSKGVRFRLPGAKARENTQPARRASRSSLLTAAFGCGCPVGGLKHVQRVTGRSRCPAAQRLWWLATGERRSAAEFRTAGCLRAVYADQVCLALRTRCEGDRPGRGGTHYEHRRAR
jgi:hypothetical protein